MGKTTIEWCDYTFNPWIGCAKISPACDNCYAEKWGKRFGVEWGPGEDRRRTSPNTWEQPILWNRQVEHNFHAWERFKGAHPELTDADLLARGFVKPRRPRVFCASLADVFDNAVNDEWRWDLFRLITATPHLDWLLLTKRIGNAAHSFETGRRVTETVLSVTEPERKHTGIVPWPNVWLGITVCNQEEANRDIPKLLEIPAAKRFVSIEPMLESIYLAESGAIPFGLDGDVYEYKVDGNVYEYIYKPAESIDWVICGGETGHGSRPMHPDWVRWLRDQCQAAGTPFFFKQWGECVEWTGAQSPSPSFRMKDLTPMVRVGKESAGRWLDGREWNEVPA